MSLTLVKIFGTIFLVPSLDTFSTSENPAGHSVHVFHKGARSKY